MASCSDCGVDPRTKLNCVCFGLGGRYADMVPARAAAGRMSKAGRVRRALAAVLQRDIPTINGVAITWLPERLYPARGRAPLGLDKYRWSGSPIFTASGNGAGLFDCWDAMAACVQAKRLVLRGNEVEAADAAV